MTLLEIFIDELKKLGWDCEEKINLSREKKYITLSFTKKVCMPYSQYKNLNLDCKTIDSEYDKDSKKITALINGGKICEELERVEKWVEDLYAEAIEIKADATEVQKALFVAKKTMLNCAVMKILARANY